jgi:hypothetical protein
MTMEDRKKALEAVAEQRYVEFLGGQAKYVRLERHAEINTNN